MVDRIKTYIDGFDDRMSGGIPKGHVVLVTGEPGTMKSSLCFSILHNNAVEEGRPSVYITLEQSREALITHMDGLGFPMSEVQDKISIVDLGLIRRNEAKPGTQNIMQVFKTFVKNMKESMDCEILVIDSLPVLELLSDFMNPRNDLFHLFEWLKGLDMTVLMIGEMTPGWPMMAAHGADFLADGVIQVKMEFVDQINVQRRIRCVKMRSTPHSGNMYSLLFNEGVFEVTRVISDGK